MIRRRHLLLAAAATAMARPGRASQTLTLLVGAKPGSATDEGARSFVPFLGRHLKFTDIEVRNVPGGAGLAGVLALAEAAPTGAVLGWGATPMLPARMV